MYARARSLLLLLALAVAGSLSCHTSVPVDQPPDLILVIIDTWRWDALGANGAAHPDLTPHLDTLAGNGVLFHRAIAPSPWTLPSVASMLTGHYPTVHGAYGRFKEVESFRAEIPTVAELLDTAGYRTLAVVNAPFLSPRFGFGRGFEVYDYFASSNRETRRAGEAVDAALAHLAAAERSEPVFLMLHLFDPHLAYDPPAPWDERWTGDYQGSFHPPIRPLKQMREGTFDPSADDLAYIRALYDGEVGYVDGELARLLREMDAGRPGGNRMVVVTADHGEEFRDHGAWEHGHSMYHELVQVPLIVVPPSSWAVPPRRVASQVRLLDLAPTLLEAAGTEVPGSMAGVSLISLMRGEGPVADRPAYSEREHLGIPSAALRQDGYTLIVYPEGQPAELYDLREDPGETRNLAPRMPDRVDNLESRLRELAEALELQAIGLGIRDDAEELDPELLEQLRSLGYVGG